MTLSESAWLALLPCAALLIAAIALLGPPLGDLALASPRDGLWPHHYAEGGTVPEPHEQARYLLALLGPLLLCAGMVALAGRHVRDDVTAGLTALARATLVVGAIAAIAYQVRRVQPQPGSVAYVAPAALVATVALTALAAVVLSRPALVERFARALRETPARRVVATAAAALYATCWLLSTFNTDATIDRSHEAVFFHMPYWLGEAFGIVNGHAPLVDFYPQYGQLSSYGAAAALIVLGPTVGVYAGVMVTGTAATLAAVFAILRRLAGSSLAALGLFVPFAAMAFFMKIGPSANRYGPASLFSLYPVRYGGPVLLLWLLVRRAQRPASGRPLALLTFAGLVAINNLEFGVPAFGATLAALIWIEPRPGGRSVARLVGWALAGAALAAALVAALTLAVSGSLPRFERILTYPRLYGREGFGSLPMPAFGFHVVVYATFVAAIAIALARRLTGGRDALTGALAWTGVFGLGAGVYFVGRSHPQVLVDLFGAWGLAVCLLLVLVVRELRQRPGRPSAVHLLVVAAFALCVSALWQTPLPWSQVERLTRTTPVAQRDLTQLTRLVDRFTEPGEAVALLTLEGHRVADRLDLRNVSPFLGAQLMLAPRQWEEAFAAMRRAGVTHLFVAREPLRAEEEDVIAAAGYELVERDDRTETIVYAASRRGGFANPSQEGR